MRPIDQIKLFIQKTLTFCLMFILTECPEEPEPGFLIRLTFTQ